MLTFKKWLLKEDADIFGFEKTRKKVNAESLDDNPILPINCEVVIETMMREKINGEAPFSAYADQIQWGRNPGAVRMVISPLGSFKSIFRKLHLDLEGREVWVCKNILPYKDIANSNFQFDENFAMGLFEKIEEIADQEINAPSHDYNKLENLTIKIARQSSRLDIKPELFIYRGITQIKKNENYLIEFECRGQGVETPGSGRLERFVIDMSYSPKTGMIRSFGHDIQSPTKGHVWYPQPSEWDEYFSSSQPEKEIIDAITAVLSTY